MYNCTCPVRKSCLFSHEYICIIIYSLSMYCKVVYDRNQGPILVSVSEPNPFFLPKLIFFIYLKKHPCFPFPHFFKFEIEHRYTKKSSFFLLFFVADVTHMSFGCIIWRLCHSPILFQYVVMTRLELADKLY